MIMGIRRKARLLPRLLLMLVCFALPTEAVGFLLKIPVIFREHLARRVGRPTGAIQRPNLPIADMSGPIAMQQIVLLVPIVVAISAPKLAFMEPGVNARGSICYASYTEIGCKKN